MNKKTLNVIRRKRRRRLDKPLAKEDVAAVSRVRSELVLFWKAVRTTDTRLQVCHLVLAHVRSLVDIDNVKLSGLVFIHSRVVVTIPKLERASVLELNEVLRAVIAVDLRNYL